MPNKGLTLKPCPFCGLKKIVVVKNNDNGIGSEGYYCCCASCESRGAWGFTKTGAIMLWNTRNGGNYGKD